MQGEFRNIEKQHLLLVEDDRAVDFFKAYLAHLDWLDVTDILPIGSGDKFEKNLSFIIDKEIKNFKQLKSIGIVRDAKDDSVAIFESIKHSLESNGFDAPTNQGRSSTGSPLTRIIILSNENGRGVLESLCIKALEGDPSLVCVHKFFDCLKEKGVSQDVSEVDKAKIHVYLASSLPAKSLGDLVSSGVLSLDNRVFETLRVDIGAICNI
jgi:hypothetical protein